MRQRAIQGQAEEELDLIHRLVQQHVRPRGHLGPPLLRVLGQHRGPGVVGDVQQAQPGQVPTQPPGVRVEGAGRQGAHGRADPAQLRGAVLQGAHPQPQPEPFGRRAQLAGAGGVAHVHEGLLPAHQPQRGRGGRRGPAAADDGRGGCRFRVSGPEVAQGVDDAGDVGVVPEQALGRPVRAPRRGRDRVDHTDGAGERGQRGHGPGRVDLQGHGHGVAAPARIGRVGQPSGQLGPGGLEAPVAHRSAELAVGRLMQGRGEAMPDRAAQHRRPRALPDIGAGDGTHEHLPS